MTDHVDRFYAALTVLAGHGHVKQRLTRAFEDNLIDIDEDELPIASKQAFADLRQSMTRFAPLNGEGAVCATVRKMSPDEASEFASQIVALYSDLVRRHDVVDVGLRRSKEASAPVPAFLVKAN